MAASAACHCVISACDAILAHRLGVRSRAADHAAVADMVARLDVEGAEEFGSMAEHVLSLKSRAEYEDREVSRADADRAVRRAKRFLEWADHRVSGQ